MQDWIDDTVTKLSGGEHALCARGCSDHKIADDPIYIDLDHQVGDYPKMPRNLDLRFYHVERNLSEGKGYCPGVDAFPESLEINAIWEGFETALLMQILDGTDGIFMDFGANVGWYTTIAAKLGYPVVAVEADLVIAEALNRNIEANELSNVHVANGFISSETPQLNADGAPRIRLLKADVEGAEGDVMQACVELFRKDLVDYAIVELTPAFKSTWDFVHSNCERLTDYGYGFRVIPDKGSDVEAFAADPLKATMENIIEGYVTDYDQVMGLFIRKGLR